MQKLDETDEIVAGLQLDLEELEPVLEVAMSPVGDNLRVWCRRFPSLMNCTTIDYYLSWPRAALGAVATTKLASLELENNDERPKLVDMCTQVHMSVGVVADDFWDVMRRKVYTTPKSRRISASLGCTLRCLRNAARPSTRIAIA